MLTKENFKKLSEIRLELERRSVATKSRIRGVAHTLSSSSDQRTLLGIKSELTACYILIAQQRGRQHLSELTTDDVRLRSAKSVEVLLNSIK